MEKIFYIIEKDMLIEDFFEEIEISRRFLSRLFREKHIKINGKDSKKNLELKKGDRIEIFIEDEVSEVEPEDMDLDIVYEDEDLIAINKPTFMVVHQTKNHFVGTLSNGIQNYFNKIGLKRKIRLVNRLDRDTSGLLLVAKNSFAHQQLSLMNEREEIIKEYLAVVNGIVKDDDGVIDLPIDRPSARDIRREILKEGKEALTHYKVLERMENSTILILRIITGRTHQIRVHLNHIGHPIIGDSLYFKESELINRQALHSYHMKFQTVRDRREVEIFADLPDDIKFLINSLKGERNSS